MASFYTSSSSVTISHPYVRGTVQINQSTSTTSALFSVGSNNNYYINVCISISSICLKNISQSSFKLRGSTIYCGSTSAYINSSGYVYSNGESVMTTSNYRSDVAGFSRSAIINENGHPTSKYYILFAKADATTTNNNGTSSTFTLTSCYVQSSSLYICNKLVRNSTSRTVGTIISGSLSETGKTNAYSQVLSLSPSAGIAYITVWGKEDVYTNDTPNGGIVIAVSSASYYSRLTTTNWEYILAKREGQWNYHGNQILFCNAWVPPGKPIYVYLMNMSSIIYTIRYITYTITG